ncbi:MAG: PAS domain S-box protein [Thermodesulfovibrionales bacterium]|nr:PAS domain S-box protein [Thermodesulfovibrionales bacterium]
MDKKQYIDKKIFELMLAWGDLVLASGAVVTLLLGVLDYLVTPENFRRFLLFRLGCASILVFLIFLNNVNKNRRNKFLQIAIFTLATAAVGSMIELMVLSFGGHQSIYYAGMILLYIFCLGFVPLNSIRLSLAYAFFAYSIYIVPILLFDTITNTKVFLNSNIFLIASALSAVLWRFYNDRLLLKNFSLEYDLSREKDHLEDLVQERNQDLKVSESKLRALFENATDGILITDEHGVILEVNQEAMNIYGFAKDALIGANLELLEADMHKAVLRERMKRLLEGKSLLFETQHYRKDGSKVSLEVGAKVVQIADTMLIQFFVRDITEKKLLQEQVVHTQKMDSIGALVAGISHNFSNLLTAILGNIELIFARGNPDEITARRMKSIESSARKAAVMVSTLLNFSRKEKFHMVPLNLNDVVYEAIKLLEGVIEKRIGIKTEFDSISRIEGDQSRLEQIILNIIMNARDAMPDGGLITIKTGEITIEKDRFDMPAFIHPGRYIVLTISDTGKGMPPDIAQRILSRFLRQKGEARAPGLVFPLYTGLSRTTKVILPYRAKQARAAPFLYISPYPGKACTCPYILKFPFHRKLRISW